MSLCRFGRQLPVVWLDFVQPYYIPTLVHFYKQYIDQNECRSLEQQKPFESLRIDRPSWPLRIDRSSGLDAARIHRHP
jgi:hypothetical protein